MRRRRLVEALSWQNPGLPHQLAAMSGEMAADTAKPTGYVHYHGSLPAPSLVTRMRTVQENGQRRNYCSSALFQPINPS